MLSNNGESIKVVFAVVEDNQGSSIRHALEQLETASKVGPVFEAVIIEGRGVEILKGAAGADVVVMVLEDDQLPGESDLLISEYPKIRVVGVNHQGRVCVVLGAVDEPLSSDLPTVIRWLAKNDNGMIRLN